jgi:ATP-dependent Clp protease adapter protein ClpS
MVNIVREVFSLFGTDVVKASYKNSVYYIVGTNDITDYVSKIKDSFDLEELDAIKYGFDAFLKDNPVSTLKVPQFELVILDNATTSASYVEQIVADIFRKDYEETHNIVNAIHHEGSAVVAKGTMELMHTFSCMVETANVATGNELETDMIEIYESESMDSMELLENLIRRDFPGDI